MLDVSAIIKIIPLFLLALISPGPDFIIVSSISLERGRFEGIKAAAGVSSVIFLYTFVSLMGMATLFERYMWLMMVIKLFGGTYLIYLGFLLIKASFSSPLLSIKKAAPSLRKEAYISGFLVCLTNPKAIAFFASIFALALTPHTSLTTNIFITLIIPLLTLAWFSIVAVSLSTPSVRIHYDRWRPFIDRMTGSILTNVGMRLLY